MNELIFAYSYMMDKIHTSEDVLFILKWAGNVYMYLGAIFVSVSITLAAEPSIFVLFLLGHIFWLIAGLAMRDKPLIFLNLFFIPLDMWAIFIRLQQ